MWHAGFLLKVDKSGLNMALTTDWAAKLASCLEKFAHISKHGCVFVRVYVKIVYVYSIIYKSVCVCERVRFLSVCECVVCLIPNCTSVQLYNYTTIHLHNCKATQLYKRANTQLYDCTTENTNIQLYTTASYRSMQPHNYTTVNEAGAPGQRRCSLAPERNNRRVTALRPSSL